jgi:hypothetical protein
MGLSEYSRLRGGIAAGMSVHSGKIASSSTLIFGPPPLHYTAHAAWGEVLSELGWQT